MKVRTALLSICMVIVPAMAMFSHHVPAEVRAAARCAIWQPVADGVRLWLGGEPVDAASSLAGDPTGESASALCSPAAETTTNDSVATTSESELATPLAGLGAVAIDCRPLEGVPGMHVASCRVALDAAGELHRVFQAPGASPAAAEAALVQQVRQWRERLTIRAASRSPVANDSPRGW